MTRMIDYQDSKHGRLECEAECYLALWLACVTELFEIMVKGNVEAGDMNTEFIFVRSRIVYMSVDQVENILAS
jgi:hypothetical protein